MKRHASEFDRAMMAECLRLAEKGMPHVSPNPMVGAVLVKGKRIVARGYHRKFGGAHAEVECLRRSREDARAATMYVNLEPCPHWGKTPPCTDLIIRSGIREVVIGMKDPNPLISGRGIRQLRLAGITVRVGVMEQEARELNRRFVKYITTNLPYVHVKIAQTLDGKIAPGPGHTRWITGKAARQLVHSWRSEYDAILVGSGTVTSDDPLLTVRLAKGEDPDVVVLDGRLRAPISARLFSHGSGRRVIVCVARNIARRHRGKIRQLHERGVTLLELPGKNGVLEIIEVLHALYWLGIGSVLVEGGAEVFRQFVLYGLFDELSMFVAPTIMRNGIPALSSPRTGARAPRSPLKLSLLSARQIGPDVILHSYKRR